MRRLTLLLLGVYCVSAQGPIRLPDIVPFGPSNGDSSLPRGNNESVRVTLQRPIPFYGQLRNTIVVSCECW